MISQKLIVLAGLPGSGKSKLAEALSRHFSLPLFSADPIEAAMWRGEGAWKLSGLTIDIE
jgi:adenylate kinase family enzyme